VLCDTGVLRTLPSREVRNGLGEVAKYGFIADPEVLRLLEGDPAAAVAGDPDLLTEVVVRGVRTKARVVAADERESGARALLNYGHTLGHAVEVVTGYGRYGHGEAVALGMVFAARLAERLGVADGGLAERTLALLRPLGLPTGGLDADPDALLSAMRGDKKARAGIRFVLCSRPGEAFLTEDPPDEAVVREVLATLR
jgi:3-dehydroquinate synthase